MPGTSQDIPRTGNGVVRDYHRTFYIRTGNDVAKDNHRTFYIRTGNDVVRDITGHPKDKE